MSSTTSYKVRKDVRFDVVEADTVNAQVVSAEQLTGGASGIEIEDVTIEGSEISGVTVINGTDGSPLYDAGRGTVVVTAGTNTASPTGYQEVWTKVGDKITVVGSFEIEIGTPDPSVCYLDVPLGPGGTTTFQATTDAGGNANIIPGTGQAEPATAAGVNTTVEADTTASENRVAITFTAGVAFAGAPYMVSYHYQYDLDQLQ